MNPERRGGLRRWSLLPVLLQPALRGVGLNKVLKLPGPEGFGPLMRPGVPLHHLRHLHAVLAPGAAVCRRVQHHRLEPIKRPREFRFRRFPRLKLFPESAHGLRLILGELGEQAVRAARFARPLRRRARRVVREGVPGVDLHEVVDQEHLDHAAGVDFFIRVFGKHHRHHGHVPRVLGVRLFTGLIREIGFPHNRLRFINLKAEIELPLEPLLFLRNIVRHTRLR